LEGKLPCKISGPVVLPVIYQKISPVQILVVAEDQPLVRRDGFPFIAVMESRE
jgi:hypothetical protein